MRGASFTPKAITALSTFIFLIFSLQLENHLQLRKTEQLDPTGETMALNKLFYLILATMLITSCDSKTPYSWPKHFLFGQPDFTTNTTLNPPTRTSLNNPESVYYDGVSFFVADRENNRVLIWHNIFTFLQGESAINNPPDIVIGQPDFVTRAGGTTDSNLKYPRSIASYKGKLLVLDTNNHRVLIWNSIPTSNGQPADVVIFQNDFTTATSGTTADKSKKPNAIFVDPKTGKLFVADWNNRRILVFNTIPTSNGASADFVLGQPDMTSVTENASVSANAYNYSAPNNIQVFQGKLYIGDSAAHRVLVWNSIPTDWDTPADYVIGQPDFTTVSSNTGGVSNKSLSFPGRFIVNANGVYIPDYNNNRIMVWKKPITSNFQAADEVIGQPNFTSITTDTTESSTFGIYSIFPFKRHFIISD